MRAPRFLSNGIPSPRASAWRSAAPFTRSAIVVALLAGSACQDLAPLPPADFIDAVPLAGDDRPARTRGHAHNDYEHPRPLLDALDQRFLSVEVDVFWRDASTIAVAHFPWQMRGELAPLYLDPLERLVRARGSVFGDGAPFFLWIDLKDDSDALVDAIDTRLSQSPDVFTRFYDDTGEDARPVRVILTGAAAKERYVERAERFAIRDSNTIVDAAAPMPDSRFGFYALSHAGLDQGSLDAAYRAAKESAGDRALRIYGAPDDEANWCAQHGAAIDWIGTDRLEALGALLDAPASFCE